MLDDAFFNVEAWINSELATEFAEQEEIAFTTGDGTRSRKGSRRMNPLMKPTRSGRSANFSILYPAEATAVTADAIIKLIYTLRRHTALARSS